jgi:hypothetical protein
VEVSTKEEALTAKKGTLKPEVVKNTSANSSLTFRVYCIDVIFEPISKIGFWFKIAADPSFIPQAYCCMLRI